MVLDDIVKGRVIRTRVGDVYVAEALKKHGAGFGGEPSGTYIFPSQTYCPDGILAAAILVSMVGDGDLAEMVDALPSYPVARRSYPFPPEKRREVESRLLEEMTSLDCDELTQVDGFRAQFANGWILLRLSGTEPKLRMAAEARSQEELGRMISLAEDVARGCIR
jgi:phosphoglucosamine mutase